MKYSELVNIVENSNGIKTRFDVISFLIGYKIFIDESDHDNIMKLYIDGFIDA